MHRILYVTTLLYQYVSLKEITIHPGQKSILGKAYKIAFKQLHYFRLRNQLNHINCSLTVLKSRERLFFMHAVVDKKIMKHEIIFPIRQMWSLNRDVVKK